MKSESGFSLAMASQPFVANITDLILKWSAEALRQHEYDNSILIYNIHQTGIWNEVQFWYMF